MLIVIPHADREYAGDARLAAFSRIPYSVTSLLYVSTNHGRVKDIPFHQTLQIQKPSEMKADHAFTWVLPELLVRFPDLERIELVTPHSPDEAARTAEWMGSFLEHKGSLLVATTDLTHFGPSYGVESFGDEAKNKVEFEQDFILDLVTKKKQKPRKQDVTDSPWVIEAVSLFLETMDDWPNGLVVDYYDSAQRARQKASGCLLDRYAPSSSSSSSTAKEFVSYVSIVFGSRVPPGKLCSSRLHLLFLFGLFKYCLQTGQDPGPDPLPSWARGSFRGVTGDEGVFVGASSNEKGTNCSIGRYEGDPSGLARKVVEAALGCLRDAQDRWDNEITPENLNRLKLKLEFLQARRDWRDVKNLDTVQKGTEGVYVEFKDGRAGIFLPSVWAENSDWTAETLLEHLRAKIGSNPSEKVSKAWAFKTTIMQVPSCGTSFL